MREVTFKLKISLRNINSIEKGDMTLYEAQKMINDLSGFGIDKYRIEVEKDV